MKSLDKQKEPEDSSNPKRWSKEPTGLTQRIHQEDTDEDCDRTRECDGIVGSDAYKTSNLKLPKHKSNQSKGTVESNKGPKPSKLAPPDEIPLSFRTPEKHKRMTHSICWSRNCRSKKVCTLKIGTCQPVSIPTRNESCPSKPTTKSKVSSGKKK